MTVVVATTMITKVDDNDDVEFRFSLDFHQVVVAGRVRILHAMYIA